MSSLFPDRMRTPQAAAHTGLSESTLAKLRVFGGGPRYIKAGRRVLYERSDLDAWLNAHKFANTSEYVHV